MKKVLFFVSVLSGFAWFSACDVIDNPVPVKDPYKPLSDSLTLDSIEDKEVIPPVVQKVLLEDYTGHTCGNCPGASVEAKRLKGIYEDRLVVMAVHANFFARVQNDGKYTYNFATPTGEEWFTTFGLQSNPNGIVNRIPAAGSTAMYQGVAKWGTSVGTQMAKAPQAGLHITTLYKPGNRAVQIKVRTQYLNALAGKYNLAVFITEDSIVKYQKNYGAAAGGDPAYLTGDVPNYVHPHALRAAVDGAWGHLNKQNPAANEVVESYFTYTLDPTWREKKCAVVAFLFNEQTNEIIQVEEKELFDH